MDIFNFLMQLKASIVTYSQEELLDLRTKGRAGIRQPVGGAEEEISGLQSRVKLKGRDCRKMEALQVINSLKGECEHFYGDMAEPPSVGW